MFLSGNAAFNEKVKILSLDESLSVKVSWLINNVYVEFKCLTLRIKAIEKHLIMYLIKVSPLLLS